MNEVKPTLSSKTVIAGIIVSIAGALGLADVITADVALTIVTVGGVVAAWFRKRATARLG